MTIDQVRQLYNAQPFRPFIIHLADGRSVPVNHPDFSMTVPGGRTTLVAQPDDRVNIIDLLLVKDIELSPPGHGSGRRRGA
jgi:hypothetical protein